MNMRNKLTALLMMITVTLTAQPRFPALSPAGSIQRNVGLTTISVIYERPAARGRIIFGNLVSYGRLWRSGAGNCTKIKISRDVVIQNKLVSAGTYALLTIPDETEWTIILNTDTALYGLQGYTEKNDLVRFKTKPEKTGRFYESFTIDIDVIQNDAEVHLAWENSRVAFKITTETDKQVTAMVTKDLLSGKIKDPELLAMGAEYYYFDGRDFATGIRLINKAIDYKPTSWYYSLKVDLLTKSQKYNEAIATLKLNMKYVKANPEKWSEEQLANVVEAQILQLKELEMKVNR